MKKQTLVIALLVSIQLLMAGFTEKTETKRQDENIVTIEAVLQNALTGPNEELKKVFNSGSIEDTVQYDKNHFEEYFANETAYMEFVNSYGAVLMIEPIRSDYKLKVRSIEYEKTDSKEIIYNFSVDLQYQNEDSEKSKVEVIIGQANLNEEHKIEDILIRIDALLGSLGN